MGFNEVFLSLKELFPQIDERALKAVAIEHSKDVDAAVASVLEEIIPFFFGKSIPNNPFNQSIYIPELSQAVSDNGQFMQNDYYELTCLEKENNHKSKLIMSANVHSLSEPVVLVDLNEADTLHVEVLGGPVTEVTNSGDKLSEKNVEISSDIIPETANFVREDEGDKESDVNENKSEKLHESLISQSSQARAVDVLKEIIEEAKNNKKTLFAAMESVIRLMKQVELKEQILEQTKAEAVLGGKNIMDKVEELKQMLQHAKEANDMHTGEVYGEKAILGTELKELQSRVLSLSDERDKSLAVLDEMRQTLEVQLAAAEKEIQSAELEKLEKENSARKLLAHQELIMEKVVQESKILKQQSEDNAKLQEFLMDHGSVVDMLQGELAVICQDVRVLKEKFDERVPISKSLFSSQTSFILASSSKSSSSYKSLVTDSVEPISMGGDDDLLETQKTVDDGLVCEHDKASIGNLRALADDGWEYCERENNA
ncbi:hypothetical protein CASFOL_010033 [Castilleja foliolosa]|uniref:CUE domain-containing protein n=1 Tax=Castilleja foliolosa TaxID=1961234 RepID=A0ABD3DRZ0_9LAMI